MSTRWRDPELEYRPPHRPTVRTTIECLAAWTAVPAACWGGVALVAYHFGWIG